MRGKMVFLSRTAYHRMQGYSRIHTNDTLPFNPTQKAAAQTGGRSTIFHYGRPTRKPEPSRPSGDHAAARQLYQLACAVVDAVLHDLGRPAGELLAARNQLVASQNLVGDGADFEALDLAGLLEA